MKKFLLLFASLTIVLGLAACGPKEEEKEEVTVDCMVDPSNEECDYADPNEGATTFEIALVTDVGTIDDGSFNQGAWEGVVRYAWINNVTHKFYQPVAKTTDDYVDAIELAIEGGATTVVCPGFLFENAVWVVQGDHPTVNFIILDGSPHNVTDWGTMATYDGGDADFTVESNVRPIFYTEHEAGFLAGYAAVQDGFTELGFIGGMAVPAVVRFGYGFVQGADQAAQDMGLADDAITINYWYSNVFWETPDVLSTASSWYLTGTEVIFAAAGGAGFAVIEAADAEGGLVIGVDIDQKDEDGIVITSALKELANSVNDTLTEIYDETFTGGAAVVFDATNNGIGLPQDFSRFDTFDQAAYDAIFAKLVDGTVVVDGDNEQSLADVAAKYAKVVVDDQN
jgi:basic membrane protein A